MGRTAKPREGREEEEEEINASRFGGGNRGSTPELGNLPIPDVLQIRAASVSKYGEEKGKGR